MLKTVYFIIRILQWYTVKNADYYDTYKSYVKFILTIKQIKQNA